MNKKLQKEIVKHIFETIGVFKVSGYTNFSMIEPLISDKFLISKKIAIDIDGEKFENNIYTATARIDKSVIKIMVADTHDDISEFTVIIQMDTFPQCAMQLSLNAEDCGSMYFNTSNNWTNSNALLQGKILVGIEEISNMILDWNRFDKYEDMYKNLIGFLNYMGQVEDAR
jgi:hypothetical protein